MKISQTIPFIICLFFFQFCMNSNSQNTTKQTNTENKIVISPKQIQDEQYKIIKDIPTPTGYTRTIVDTNSYSEYLRNLPIRQENNIVFLYNGEKKYNQSAQFAVIDIDVGTRDLQQCADAVMRLRAEYLFENKQYDEIHFNFLGDGKPRYYTNYAGSDRSYKKFRKYMDYIFAYANTSSLHNEMISIDLENMQIGDVFIQKGRPYGHSITVVDMAENINTGDKVFMLTQSYMPAQDIHILKNPTNSELSPWYSINFGEELQTPEWIFTQKDLKRFE